MAVPIPILVDHLRPLGKLSYIGQGNRSFSQVERYDPEADPREGIIYVCTAEEYLQFAETIGYSSQDKLNDVPHLNSTSKSSPPETNMQTQRNLSADETSSCSLPDPARTISLLCITITEEEESQVLRTKTKSLQLVWMVDDASNLPLYIKGMQDRLHKILQWQYNMANDMLCGSMYQEILELSEEFFPDPIYITDSHHRLVAHTQNREPADANLELLTEQGYLDIPILLELRDKGYLTDGLVPRLYRHTQGTGISKEDGPSRLVNAIFRVDGSFYLHMFTIKTDGPITPGFLFLFDALAESIGHCVAKDSRQKKVLEGTDNGLRLLVDGQRSISDDLLNHIYASNVDINEPLRLLLVKSKREIALGIYADLLQKVFPESIMETSNNEIVAICNAAQEETFMTGEKWVELDDFCTRNDLDLGISGSFFDLDNTYFGYQQAKMVIDLSSRLQRLGEGSNSFKRISPHFYKHATLCLLLTNDARRDEMLKFLSTNNIIVWNLKGDTAKATDDIVLLYQWLNSNGNINELARLRGVHRNTIYNRLNAIADLLRVDLNEEDMRQYLRLLFNAMTLMGSFDLPC